MRFIDTIVVHHSANAVEAFTWKQITDYHINVKKYDDCGYHYGLVDDGNGFEVKVGRPVDKVGAHAGPKGNPGSIGICFEGNFEKGRVPVEQFLMGAGLIVRLVDKYGITKIVPHRDIKATLCPGKFFPIEALRGWVADEQRFTL